MSVPWTPLHVQLHQTLKARHLLPAEDTILIAISGGQDSLCLAQLLLDLQSKWGWHLGLAHCNHRWREDAQANANHIAQLATHWNLPYHEDIASSPPPSEAAARHWRYQTLTAIAHTHHYRHLTTGHTATDRAETFLYNLMRGSGLDGLQALTWNRPLSPTVQLVRPLLNVTRAQTQAFCLARDLPIWYDETNQNLRFARNRIRLELLPYLATHFNPQVHHHIAQTAETLQADVEYLEQTAQILLQRATRPFLSHGQGLNRQLIQTAHLALQRRVFRQFLKQALPCDPTFRHIEKCRALLIAPNGSQTDPFPGGAIARVQGPWIWLTSSPLEPPPPPIGRVNGSATGV